ncbi:MAG: phenylalanine--tRNA ligase subunit beta [Phycisphaerae bacterium]|nr:phenylalanine--tRNA ligase subunit beta [Phycisphaerae bacterium]
MPIVNMSVDTLLKAVNRGVAKPLDVDGLRRGITAVGTEVEELAVLQQFGCARCGRTIERTEAQGAPVDCPQCHADFREDTAARQTRGENRVLRLNMLAARPDIFDPGGMARCLRGYFDIEPGFRKYAIRPATTHVVVDPRMEKPESYRPYIACAVLRGLKLDDERVKTIMNLQENLHWALGRDRKLASIGAYDLAALRGPAFSYAPVGPDEIRFVPLGFNPKNAADNVTPREMLERHGTGKKYARLLAGLTAYPALRDSAGTVLSLPPIINGESSRVTQSTTDMFIDVTGLSQRVVDRALNVMVTGLVELMPEIVVEQVELRFEGRPARLTPALQPGRMSLSAREAAETVGVTLSREEIVKLLARMGHDVEPGGGDTLTVLSPAYRNDLMHPIDLIEDVAVAYGFDRLPAELVPTFTVGVPREIEERCALARRVLAGLGFHQVMTLGLTNESAAFDKLNLAERPEFRDALLRECVRIENPISVDQTICRVSLIPGLLETFAINKQHDLPQQLFEVGDVCLRDPKAETGAREHRRVAAAMVGTHVGFADIRAVLDAFLHEFGRNIGYEACQHPSFIPGRAAVLRGAGNEPLGYLGELHPQVLENYGLRHPVALFELAFE